MLIVDLESRVHQGDLDVQGEDEANMVAKQKVVSSDKNHDNDSNGPGVMLPTYFVPFVIVFKNNG